MVTLALFYIPLAVTVVTSLYNWPLVGPRHFIGLANYEAAFQDPKFLHSLVFSTEYTAIVTPMIFLFGYALAVIVRQRRRGVGFLRTVYFLPFVIGFATAAYIFLLFLQPGYGIIDQLIRDTGLSSSPIGWLQSPGPAVLIISVIVTWKTVGFTMILLMAGMQAIPEELYEAARVDGAGWLNLERRITIPLLRRTLALALVISVIGSYLAFDQFYILTQGGPENSTITPVIWIYESDFLYFKLGYGAALSLIILVILVILSVIQIRALRDRTAYS